MDSYRVEKQAIQALVLPDAEGLIGPVPVSGGGQMPEPVLDVLSNIIKSFNDQFGKLFKDPDRVAHRVVDDIAPKVAADPAYQNAKQNTPQNARIAGENALAKIMLDVLQDDTEIYKQFVQNPSFKRAVTEAVFNLTK